jgi:nucleoid-associated protein YgaU
LVGVLLKDRAAQDRVLGVSGEVKDSVLVVLHPADVLVKRAPAVGLLGRVESRQEKTEKVSDTLKKIDDAARKRIWAAARC